MPIRGRKQRLTDNNISNSPSDSGVYVLSNYGEVMYIGKAEGSGGIKSRLQAAKRDDTPCMKIATSFQIECCKDPTKRENQLIDQYKKTHAQLPRHNDIIG
ncbi:hypothetical protein ACFLXT_04130 [Chloroflexota bacterium]